MNNQKRIRFSLSDVELHNGWPLRHTNEGHEILRMKDGTTWSSYKGRWTLVGRPGLCVCETDVEDIGPYHVNECRWSDPDYEETPF